MPTKIDKYKLSRSQDRRCKTSDEDVLKMKYLYRKEGLTQQAIADMFGISKSAVGYIVSPNARAGLADYRKRNPSKRRTKKESRNYARELRAYKRELVEKEKERDSNETSTSMDSV